MGSEGARSEHEGRERRIRLARVLAVVTLLAAGFGIQLYFFRHYPQPILFGDPRGYYETGQRFLEALARVRAGEGLSAAFESVRGLFYLVGVGSLFAVMEALRPRDLAFFRLFLAGFNTLTMLGVFLLARRLARSDVAGFVALVLALFYPAFSVQTGRLYPDPVTSCFFVFATWLYLEGVTRQSARCLILAGLALTGAVVIRSQLALYILLALPLTLVLSSPLWLRDRLRRRLALAFVLSLLPLVLVWGGIDRAVGTRDDVIRLGNLTFRPPYPYGFWQFLETDGWGAAYAFKAEPFYRAMWEENQRHPGLLSSRSRQIGFTLRHVAARPGQSVGAVLNNVYRLLDRPANDYKWGYPLPYDVQVWVQRSVVLLALCGLAVFAAEGLSALGVFFIPLSLVTLHGLMFVWPRYNVPLMPILIAAAGAFVGRLVQRFVPDPVRDRPLFALFLLVAVTGVLGEGLVARAPEAAYVLQTLSLLAALSMPFVLLPRLTASPRGVWWAGAAWLVLTTVVTAHAVRDRLWHELSLDLGGRVSRVEQGITLTPEALARLRDASQAFVVFDLSVPRGDASVLTLEVAGRRFAGTALVPTMPKLPESTSTGGRDWRDYPQWWALPLEASLLPTDAAPTLHVSVAAPATAAVRLGGDRHSAQERLFEGPAFGERPNIVPLKLEYDGDYRLPIAYTLASAGTRTALVDRQGRRQVAPFVARIRIVTLDRNEGSTVWRTAAAPASAAASAPPVAFGFFAYAGVRGQADLRVDGVPVLRFPLGQFEDARIEAGPWSFCRRDLGERGDKRYGAFVLSGPAPRGRGVEVEVRFRTGMDERPMYFVVDRRRRPEELVPHFESCGIPAGGARVPGVAEVTDAGRNSYPDDTGRWTIREVF